MKHLKTLMAAYWLIGAAYAVIGGFSGDYSVQRQFFCWPDLVTPFIWSIYFRAVPLIAYGVISECLLKLAERGLPSAKLNSQQHSES